jgi:hypothetical protein
VYEDLAPVEFVYDRKVPTPAALIPNLDDDELVVERDEPQLRMAPLPHYHFVDYHPRGIPVESGPLKAFPFIGRLWEIPTETNDFVADAVNSLLKVEVSADDGEGGMTQAEAEAEERYLLADYVDHDAFGGADPGRTSLIFRLFPSEND